MNIHIVKGLLGECPGLINHFFTSETFSYEDCLELKRLYDTAESPQSTFFHSRNEAGDTHLSFGCNFSKEQLVKITECANTHHLFYSPEVSIQDMADLLTCKKGFHIRVNNVRRIAIMFDAMLENSLIEWDWQYVLGKGKFLLAKNAKTFVSASSLSSTLSSSRGRETSAATSIRKVIAGLKAW